MFVGVWCCLLLCVGVCVFVVCLFLHLVVCLCVVVAVVGGGGWPLFVVVGCCRWSLLLAVVVVGCCLLLCDVWCVLFVVCGLLAGVVVVCLLCVVC